MRNYFKTNNWLLLITIILVISCTMKSDKNKKFPISLETSVFTTIYVIEEGKEITTVIHDDEGDWQFFSNDEINDFDKVAKLVSLQQIIDIDSTILKLYHMPRNKTAQRSSINGKWKIK